VKLVFSSFDGIRHIRRSYPVGLDGRLAQNGRPALGNSSDGVLGISGSTDLASDRDIEGRPDDLCHF
jgi:hypothetical protein